MEKPLGVCCGKRSVDVVKYTLARSDVIAALLTNARAAPDAVTRLLTTLSPLWGVQFRRPCAAQHVAVPKRQIWRGHAKQTRHAGGCRLEQRFAGHHCTALEQSLHVGTSAIRRRTWTALQM